MIPDDNTLRRLLDAGRSLVTELDPDGVFDRILEAARDTTGARYAALGVLNEQRTGLGRFIWQGIDTDAFDAIGRQPVGRGVLGALIEHPQPLRVDEVSAHPLYYGFPSGHPVMRSFLGVPIMIRGEAWGNLYLAEKAGAQPFTAADEEATVILAGWAAAAIENARLYSSSERRRERLERAVRGLQAAQEIADLIGSGAALPPILDLIVARGRTLVEARSVLILLRDGDALVVAACDGQTVGALGRRVPVSASTAGEILEHGHAVRVSDVARELQANAADVGVPDARTALLVPMIHAGAAVGVLAAFDRGEERAPFTAADEQLLRTFAASGGNAVAIRRSVEADRLRSAMVAAELERARWARELHDETLQGLGSLRVLLASAVRSPDPERHVAAMRSAITEVEREIESLRAIVADLRPSLLDDLGLLAALEALLERRRRDGIRIDSRLRIPGPGGPELAKDLETTTYRLVQEALTNVIKHARATVATVLVELSGDQLIIAVSDDGRGFDPDGRTAGFGLAGMRERVYLSDGVLDVSSDPSGTRVRITLPADRGAADSSIADQLVS